MSIVENTALFALIGTMYGGNGRTTMGIPDLQGRAPIGSGKGVGLTNDWCIGDPAGLTRVILQKDQIPSHNHTLFAVNQSHEEVASANNAVLGIYTRTAGPPRNRQIPLYSPPSSPSEEVEYANEEAIGATGSTVAHDNMQPYGVLNFCIALTGVFPPRN